ncbi:MAG: acyl-CoA dehydrogenase family protein [Candidatus Binataceae bacterium]
MNDAKISAVSSARNGPAPVTKAELLARASALVPVLRERAAACEKLRRIPDETVADFCSAQIHLIAQPVSYGGLGLDMDAVYEVAAELGRGCGSSGWMGCFWPLHNWMVGLFPKPAQDEYWADSHSVLSSTASATVRCSFEPAKGGMRLSGQWNFASGIDHAQWIQLITRDYLVLLPRKDFRIEDNWFVAGLRGSGSKGVIVDNVFVPEHRLLPAELLLAGNSPGRKLHDSAFYRVPMFAFLGYSLAAPIIGMGQGAVDLFEQMAGNRTDSQTGERVIEKPLMQACLADASASVDAARLLMLRDLRDVREYGAAEKEMPLAERARTRRDIAFAVRTCVRAANSLYEMAGAHAIYEFSPMQRMVRDINAASHSVAVTWDVPAENYGRVRWGLPPNTCQI